MCIYIYVYIYVYIYIYICIHRFSKCALYLLSGGKEKQPYKGWVPVLGPDPFQMLNLVKRCRLPQTKASGMTLVSKSSLFGPEPSVFGAASRTLNLVK